MNAREARIATLTFGRPDRVPFEPGYGRKSTMERWRKEGLDPSLDSWQAIGAAYAAAGGRLALPPRNPGFACRSAMIPAFEEKVIEVRPNSQIVQDWKGNICEIGLEFDLSYLRSAVDFVTRSWIKCPVETRADWVDMQRRYNPASEGRFPVDAAELGRQLKNREGYIKLGLSGPFWQMREWCGFEPLCMMFYDDTALVEEMIEFWENYISSFLARLFEYVVPDEICVSEDMAYKEHSMLSPGMARQYLLPTWSRWGEQMRRAGVPVYSVDSDGFIGELIPLWIEAGVQACDPIEVAAGNDIVDFRRRFGREMAYSGGVDKREIAKGGRAIEREIARLRPVIDDGGFVPGCDHAVPSDVSWPAFIDYCRELGKATGWIS